MSIVYTPKRPRARRLDMNTAGALALAVIHEHAGLPFAPSSTHRVPYIATKHETRRWGDKLAAYLRDNRIPEQPDLANDINALARLWSRFLILCEGYNAG